MRSELVGGLFVALVATSVAVGALDNINLRGPKTMKGLTLEVLKAALQS